MIESLRQQVYYLLNQNMMPTRIILSSEAHNAICKNLFEDSHGTHFIADVIQQFMGIAVEVDGELMEKAIIIIAEEFIYG